MPHAFDKDVTNEEKSEIKHYSDAQRDAWVKRDPIHPREWSLAKTLLDAAPEGTKLSRKDLAIAIEKEEKEEKDKISVFHSFIKLDKKIYAFPKKDLKLGEGSFGIAKLIRDAENNFYVLKIGRSTLKKEGEKTFIPSAFFTIENARKEEEIIRDVREKIDMGIIKTTERIIEDRSTKHYILMPFLGLSLSGPTIDITLAQRFFLLLQITILHSHGYLHNDIRPENIVIDHKGRPYLIDFSISEKIPAEEKSRFSKDIYDIITTLNYKGIYYEKNIDKLEDKKEKIIFNSLHYSASTLTAIFLFDCLLSLPEKEEEKCLREFYKLSQLFLYPLDEKEPESLENKNKILFSYMIINHLTIDTHEDYLNEKSVRNLFNIKDIKKRLLSPSNKELLASLGALITLYHEPSFENKSEIKENINQVIYWLIIYIFKGVWNVNDTELKETMTLLEKKLSSTAWLKKKNTFLPLFKVDDKEKLIKLKEVFNTIISIFTKETSLKEEKYTDITVKKP